jgi:hypothetical protein
LAGVLGGFLITAIALLFDRNNRESVHTIALFSSAVLILMLDSYLFSIITGAVVPDDGDRRGICAIVWTQGAVLTGMLAAGTTALFGGLGWMLASHAVSRSVEQQPQDVPSYCFLADLGGWLTFASAMAMMLVLSETSIDYLHFMCGERPPLWVVGLITVSAAVHRPDRLLARLRPDQGTAQVTTRRRGADAADSAFDQVRHRRDDASGDRGRRADDEHQPLPHGLADHAEHGGGRSSWF